MTLFQEGNTVSNNKLIFPVALKTIIKYNKYNFKQYIHIHNKISQSEYNEFARDKTQDEYSIIKKREL
jgi:disulfide oxidoreductase YuzD